MLYLLTVEFTVKPDSLLAILVISDTSLSAARKYFLPSFQPRSVRLFFFHVAYSALIIPVDSRWVCSCRTMPASLIGTSPSVANFWQSYYFLK